MKKNDKNPSIFRLCKDTEKKKVMHLKTSKKRGISSIIGGFLFLVLLGGSFTAYVTLMNANTEFLETQIEIAEQGAKKTQEEISINACVNDFDNRLFVDITNSGSNTAKMADVYVESLSDLTFPVTRYEVEFEDTFVPVEQTKNIVEQQSIILTPGNYKIKAVSSFGTQQIETITVLETVPEGTFKGIFTSENLDKPTYFAFGPAPDYNVYVSNTGTDTVNKYEFPSGNFIIDVFINLDVAGLDKPSGLVFGSGTGQSDDLFVISSDTDEIQIYDKVTGDFLKDFVDADDPGELNGGWDLAFNSSGELYVTNSNPSDNGVGSSDNEILKYSTTGIFDSILYNNASVGPDLDEPTGLAYDSANNHLYVANNKDDNILRIDLSTGIGIVFADSLDGLDEPRDIVFDSVGFPTGYLYVANNKDDKILRIDSSGVTTVFADNDLIDDPNYLAVDSNDYIYVSNHKDDNVVRCTGVNVCAEFVSEDNTIFEKPQGLIFDSSDRLYLSNRDDDVVDRFASDGAFDSIFVKKIGAMNDPQAMDFGSDGNLYVAAEGSNGVFRHFTSTFAKSGVFVGEKDNNLTNPVGLVWGPDNNLYVTDKGGGDGQQVYRYKPNSNFDKIFIANNPELDTAKALTFNSDAIDAKLYIPSANDNEVLRYTAAGVFDGELITGGLGGLDHPREIVIGPNGKLYVSSHDDNEILRFTSGGSFDGVFVSTDESGGLDRPIGLAFGPNGDLYVASNDTDQILIYQGPLANTENFTCALE